jgi:hypothetical protein
LTKYRLKTSSNTIDFSGGLWRYYYLVNIPACDILGYLLAEYPKYWTSRGQRPAWRRWWQLGESVALAAAASLAAKAAAWQERGVGGVGSAAAA